ncbi:hypothetical protein [Marinitenerispora sediminis]|uniref:hypothetical protein n=1 Tax=Marinitenerispora sediminis TaxID=1931232 RepID=UPI001F17C78D|nr:hypothetical protein [Marinitenerispora sediminis]
MVVIGAVGALSLAVAGCGSTSGTGSRTVTAYCVDRDSRGSTGGYRVVDEDNCDGSRPASYTVDCDERTGRPTEPADRTPSPSSEYGYEYRVDDDCDDRSGSSGYQGGSGYSGYHYYYGGTVSNGRVSGGSISRPRGVTIRTERGTTIQRGGVGGRGDSGTVGG